MKKPFNYLLFIPALIIILSSTSCNKYEEGPRVSLRSKKSRAANQWRLVFRSVNFYPQRLDWNDLDDVYELRRGGEFAYFNPSKPPVYGNWSFINNKEVIRIITPANWGYANVTDWEIIRLAENELWVRNYNGNGQLIESHFEPAH